MALVALAPSLALSSMTGLRVEYCILIIGLVATCYTAIGGITAVIWNDAVQFILFVLAQFLIIVFIATRLDGGFAEIWHRGIADQKITVDMSIDFSRHTFWTVLIACVFIATADLGSDQLVVQRLISTKDAASAARSLWFNALFKFPSIVLLLGMGAALWAFYQANPEQLGLPASEREKILPYFVVTQLPPGLSGLVISGIFAAAMSSFDSGLNTLVTAFTVDWYKRLVRTGRPDAEYLLLAKALTFVLGVAVTLLALIIYWRGITGLVDASNSYLGFFGGGLLGVFLLGVLTRRAKGLPTILGSIISVAAVTGFELYQTNHHVRYLDPWLYGLITCTVTMVIGYFGSFFGPELPYEKVAGYTMAREPRQRN
jgi:SSS family transporter